MPKVALFFSEMINNACYNMYVAIPGGKDSVLMVIVAGSPSEALLVAYTVMV